MMSLRDGGKVAGDAGSFGAVVGLVVSIVVAAVLLGLSILNDRSERAQGMGWSCLMRIGALLVLTLGLGVGYMVAHAVGG